LLNFLPAVIVGFLMMRSIKKGTLKNEECLSIHLLIHEIGFNKIIFS